MSTKLSDDILQLANIRLVDGKYEFIKHVVTKHKKKRIKKKKEKEKKATLIKWGNVEQILFSRGLGCDVVPSSGSFPLGLDEYSEIETCSVEDYDHSQQSDLFERAQRKNIPLCFPIGDIKDENSSSSSSSSSVRFETRQWDFKKGSKNPLFTSLGEADRRVLIVDSIHQAIARERSNSFGSGSRERSSSIGSEIFTKHGSHHNTLLSDLNKDLNTIRNSRDQNGCNCKPLKLDKLSVAKMKIELCKDYMKNGQLIDGMFKEDVDILSKIELTSILRERLKICILCVTNNCECVVAGLECSDQICKCLGKSRDNPACGNPAGFTMFDADKVQDYRENLIKKSNKTENLIKKSN
jgi:hypothetical protein